MKKTRKKTQANVFLRPEFTLTEWGFWILVLIVNILRFIGLETSPPGFFTDEAVGSAQAICIKQTGADLLSNHFPMFIRGLGAGYYTAPYIYGQIVWTSIFGNSIYAFRSFASLVTVGTLVFLYLWTKKKFSRHVALIAVTLASISPWAFQFSRIAWDPPLAPFFLILGLWCFDLNKKYNWICGSFAFALASYAYPASRVQAMVLLLILPGLKLRNKIQSVILFLLLNIPLVYKTMTDWNFSARSKLMILWSDYPGNPYHGADIFTLFIGFVKNFCAHLTPEFLVVSGDHNVRHSVQTFGMLSYPEAFLIAAGFLYFIFISFRAKKIQFAWIIVFILASIATGILPAALTWEGVPHALRAIGAWPFFVILAALIYGRLLPIIPELQKIMLLACVTFFGFYAYHYFYVYPQISQAWYQTDANAVGYAYDNLTTGGISCETLQKGINSGSF